SQQLAMLRGAALISARREARSVVYRLMDGTTTHLVDALLHPAHEPSPMTAAAPRPVPSAAPTGRVAPRQSAVFATVGENA
ncbi:MAG: helix-turn-helix transcriptional regulator, partial [Rhodospirillales bacterium]|nr:helix-turn-helix transcriptional regulator [Rhodospirillales bacterium]